MKVAKDTSKHYRTYYEAVGELDTELGRLRSGAVNYLALWSSGGNKDKYNREVYLSIDKGLRNLLDELILTHYRMRACIEQHFYDSGLYLALRIHRFLDYPHVVWLSSDPIDWVESKCGCVWRTGPAVNPKKAASNVRHLIPVVHELYNSIINVFRLVKEHDDIRVPNNADVDPIYQMLVEDSRDGGVV